jgi:protein TonB
MNRKGLSCICIGAYGTVFETGKINCSLKIKFMKTGRLKTVGQLWILSIGLAFFSVACNNQTESTTSSSAADSSNAAVANDTTMTEPETANSSNEKAVKKQTTKKGRASAGAMATSNVTLMKPDKNGVYESTDVRPAYPGGQSALEDYIASQIEYPQMAIDDNKEGTVTVQFVVDENGKVTNANVLGSSLGDGLDNEAVRVISQMPKWEPGKVKGKNVKTRLTLPITYRLEE